VLLTDQTLQSIISREDPVDETLYNVWYKGWWANSGKRVTETVMYDHQNSLEIIAYTNILSDNSLSPISHYRFLTCVAMLPCPRKPSYRRTLCLHLQDRKN